MLLFQVLAKNTEIDKDTEQNRTEIASNILYIENMIKINVGKEVEFLVLR